MNDIPMLSIEKNKKEGIKACFPMSEYNECKNSKDNLSYWYPQIQKYSFNSPRTWIIQLSHEQFAWARCDDYQNNEMEEFNSFVLDSVKKLNVNFNAKNGMFIKTGNFSNKFFFDRCHIYSPNDIAENFIRHIFYNSMVVGCTPSPEIVIREFIPSKQNRKTIYHGLPLNTEFRAFIDFNKPAEQAVLGIFNYWDKETMLSAIRDKKDISNFKSEINEIEEDFEKLKPALERLIKEKLSKWNSSLSRKWSVDFLHDGKEFWLIDMAPAEKSYYYDKIK